MLKKIPNYDRVNLVNDRDEIIGSADKLAVHLGEASLHQAISLFLFKKNDSGGFDLLMQKRNQQKIVGANQWANTVCGNVAMGETHLQCLWRRLREELGINLSKHLRQQVTEIAVLNYQIFCNQKYSEKEIDHIFALFLNNQQVKDLLIKPSPLEVSKIAWVKWPILSKNGKFSSQELTPWFKLFLDEVPIMQAINQFLQSLNSN